MTVSPDLPKALIDGKAAEDEPATITGREDAAPANRSWIPVCAMAAGLLLGVMLAASFGIGADMRSAGGALLAQGSLAHILSTTLVSDESDHQPPGARVGASFWSKNGSFCRTFLTQSTGQTALAGIACRERGAWRIPVLAAIDSRSTGDSLSVGNLPAPVRSVMDNLIVGAPLDKDAERQARNQAWRPR